MLHEIAAIADDSFDNSIHHLRTPLSDKMIEFWRLLSFNPAEKLILEAFGSNGFCLPSAGLKPDCGSPEPSGRSFLRPKSNHFRTRQHPRIASPRAIHELIHKRICLKKYLRGTTESENTYSLNPRTSEFGLVRSTRASRAMPCSPSG